MEPLVQNAIDGNLEQLAWRLGKPQSAGVLTEALHRACQCAPRSPEHASHKRQAVQMLVKAGALVDQEDELFGSTPIHEAIKRGDRDLVEVLLDAGSLVHLPAATWRRTLPPVITACYEGHIPILDLLLARGASLGTQGAAGRCALSYAAEGDHPAVVDHLLALGMSINATNGIGNTVIHDFPCYMPDMIDQLIARGADLSRPDFMGLSVMDLALRHENIGCRHMRQVLASVQARVIEDATVEPAARHPRPRI